MAITVYACRELYLLLILNLIQMKKFLLLSLFLSALYVRAAVVPVSGTETIADADCSKRLAISSSCPKLLPM